jgi:hypothetical protein
MNYVTHQSPMAFAHLKDNLFTSRLDISMEHSQVGWASVFLLAHRLTVFTTIVGVGRQYSVCPPYSAAKQAFAENED